MTDIVSASLRLADRRSPATPRLACGRACLRRNASPSRHGHTAFPDCRPLGAASNIDAQRVVQGILPSAARDGYRPLGIVRKKVDPAPELQAVRADAVLFHRLHGFDATVRVSHRKVRFGSQSTKGPAGAGIATRIPAWILRRLQG